MNIKISVYLYGDNAYDFGKNITGYRRVFHPRQYHFSVLCKSKVALFYRLRRSEPASVCIYQLVPDDDVFEKGRSEITAANDVVRCRTFAEAWPAAP